MTNNDVPDFLIWIIERELTDGSSVWDVEIDDKTFNCPTEDDAEELARGVSDLINKHTNTTADVIFG